MNPVNLKGGQFSLAFLLVVTAAVGVMIWTFQRVYAVTITLPWDLPTATAVALLCGLVGIVLLVLVFRR